MSVLALAAVFSRFVQVPIAVSPVELAYLGWLTGPVALMTALVSFYSKPLAQRRPLLLQASLWLAILTAVAIMWALIASQVMWPLMRELDLLNFPFLTLWVLGSMTGLLVPQWLRWRPGHAGPATPKVMRRLTRQPAVVVVLVLGLPVTVIVLQVVQLNLAWTVFAEPHIYLVPDQYEGPLLIVYAEAAGIPLRYEGRARVYEFRPSGVLRTQAERTHLVYHAQAYYVNQLGQRVRHIAVNPHGCSFVADANGLVVCNAGGYSGQNIDAFIVGFPSALEAHLTELDALFKDVRPSERVSYARE